jgi:hypothetical protein
VRKFLTVIKMVKKGYLEIGNSPVEVSYQLNGLLCLNCENFDIKAYEEDFIKNHKRFSTRACKGCWAIFDGKGPLACSDFKPKGGNGKEKR